MLLSYTPKSNVSYTIFSAILTSFLIWPLSIFQASLDKLATLDSKSKLSVTLKRHDSVKDTLILSLFFQPACITSTELLFGVTFDVKSFKNFSTIMSDKVCKLFVSLNKILHGLKGIDICFLCG